MNIWLLIRYGISGVIGIVTNIVTLYILTDLLGIWYLASAVLAFCITLVVTFSLQKYWTFKDHEGEIMTQGVTYTIIALTSLVIGTVSLYVAVDVFKFWYLGSQVVIMCALAGWNFLANKYFTFNTLISDVQS